MVDRSPEGRGAAVGLVLGGAISIQFGAAFAVTLFDSLGPGGAVFLRLLLAAAILLAIYRPRRRERDLKLPIAFGLVLGGMNWAFYEAIDRIPLGPTVTFEFVGPLAVAVWGSRRPLDFVWIVLAAIGIVALADPFGEPLDGTGVALALFAGVLWGAYIMLSARTGRLWPGASGLAIGCAAGALLTLPAGIHQAGAELVSPELLAGGLVVALGSSVIPYTLEMEALRRLPEAVFGVLMSLEPALAALAGFLVLEQELSPLQAVAIGFVVIASAGATWQTATVAQP